MSRLIWCLGVLSLLCLAECSAAAELCSGSLGRDLRCTRCATIPCCCPDDYCRKPFPCVPCPPQLTSANDYCRKPLPCLPCLRMSWCADDYCRKAISAVLLARESAVLPLCARQRGSGSRAEVNRFPVDSPAPGHDAHMGEIAAVHGGGKRRGRVDVFGRVPAAMTAHCGRQMDQSPAGL